MPVKKKKKVNKPIKTVTVPAVQYTDVQIIDAIKATGGYLSHTAEYLQCPLNTLKKLIDKSKVCKDALFEVKESCTELAESQLMEQIKKGNMLAIMFYLKCQAGWNDRPDKQIGSSVDKPLVIKIIGVNGAEMENPKQIKRGRGRPKKIEMKPEFMLPSGTEDFIEGEVVE